MATNPQTLETAIIPRKSMQGKYDKRGKYERKTSGIKYGRKPLHEKHLSRNTAAKLFRELNIHDFVLQILRSDDNRLRFEVVRYLWDRLEGKPFIAVNPAENKQTATLHQDNRLQVAISQLVMNGKPAKKKKTKALEAIGATPAKPSDPPQLQSYVETPQVVDNTDSEPADNTEPSSREGRGGV